MKSSRNDQTQAPSIAKVVYTSLTQAPANAHPIVKKNTVRFVDPAKLPILQSLRRQRRFQQLVELYTSQLSLGCRNIDCKTPTCFTCRKEASLGPLRRPTPHSALAIACYLATQDDPEKALCPDMVKLYEPGLLVTPNPALSNSPVDRMTIRKLPSRKDSYSFVQNLFDTHATSQLEWIPKSWPPFSSGRYPSVAHTVNLVRHGEVSAGMRFMVDLIGLTLENLDELDLEAYQQTTSIESTFGSQHPQVLGETVTHFNLEILKGLMTLRKHSLAASHPGIPQLETPEEELWYMAAKKEQQRIIDFKSRSPFRQVDQTELFIESSMKYVLSSPRALIASFRKKGTPGDFQSRIVRLTSTAIDKCFALLLGWNTELVLTSLFDALACLFMPPPDLAHFRPPRSGQSSRSSSRAGSFSRSNSDRRIPTIDEDYVSDEEALHLIILTLHALAGVVPKGSPLAWYDFRRLRNSGKVYTDSYQPDRKQPHAHIIAISDALNSELAQRLANRLFRAIATRKYISDIRAAQAFIDQDAPLTTFESITMSLLKYMQEVWQRDGLQWDSVPSEAKLNAALTGPEAGMGWSLPLITLDWLHAAIQKDWDGKQQVGLFSVTGAAIGLMASMYDQRQTIGIDPLFFQVKRFSVTLDAMEVAENWLNSEPSLKVVHLLSHSWLFPASVVVGYFRALSFCMMSKSFEGAMATSRLMQQMLVYGRPVRGVSSNIQDRLKPASSTYLVLDISREQPAVDAWDQLWRRERRELLRPLKIRMGMHEGEEGVDHGGVQQEFFRIALADLMKPEHGMFIVDSLTQMTWFNPYAAAPTHQYELFGILLSLALYNGVTVPITFPLAFYRKLLALPVTEIMHIQDGWPDLAKGFKTLLDWSDGDVADIFVRGYEFTVDAFGTPFSVDMSSHSRDAPYAFSTPASAVDAPLVTNENREQFVSDYIFWLTEKTVARQFAALRSGFYTCFEPKAASMFTPEALQRMVEGIQEIDIQALERATRYEDGYNALHRLIRDFWGLVRKFSHKQKMQLLEFVTASDRVPVNGAGSVLFVIQRNGGDSDRVPTSLTCFGRLLLPEYSSREKLEEKLLLALENGKGFGVP